jgi:hypothetical protein
MPRPRRPPREVEREYAEVSTPRHCTDAGRQAGYADREPSGSAVGTIDCGVAVTDEAILRIKEMLLNGQLRPGDRLPPEKELSEELGLSHGSLREAAKALELIRVLDVRRGDGTYVTSLEPRLLLEAMSFVVDLHQDASILDLFEVRRILEPAAAVLAARRADPPTWGSSPTSFPRWTRVRRSRTWWPTT